MMTGGKIEYEWFDGGWAKSFGFGVAHHFDMFFDASCGAKVLPLFHIGDWTACKRCVAKHGKPTIQQREVGRNAEAEFLLLREIERQRELKGHQNG